jgi:hypothetical protein
MSTGNAIPVGMCLPCCSPKAASGTVYRHAPAVAMTESDAIQPGQWVRFAHWPLGPDNPPRLVDHLTARGCAVLAPLPGWRTYARTMDLLEVTEEERQTYMDRPARDTAGAL